MNKTDNKSKKQAYNYYGDQDTGHRSLKKLKSLNNKKQFRQLDNVLRTKDVNKILEYKDDY